MKNLKKISRENLKTITGGTVKMEHICITVYGCPRAACIYKGGNHGGGDVECL